MTIKKLFQLAAGFAIAGLAACSGGGSASTAPKVKVSIIPLPARLTETPDSFLIDKQTVLVAASEADKQTAGLFNEYFKNISGFALKVQDSAARNMIVFSSMPAAEKGMPETYRLKIGKDQVTVEGEDAAGTFYGMQTLIQLLPLQQAPSYWIAGVEVFDQPRFSYRGLHLDVGRHFFPVDFIKKYIDLMAMHKMNTFHWHLTEDQGWRIEIKKYPRLQEVASRRKETMEGHYEDQQYDGKAYGGFYTQEQIKDVVAYATARHVTVIPEIEMPGHSLAALTAYPHLGCTGGPYEVGTRWGVYDDVYCAGNDTVFTFLQDVLDEVMILFPGKYIHIGGDESPKTRWEKCPKCQARIKAEGLKDEHALQSWFIRRIEKYLNDKGRQIIGWDEILEGGLAPNATVMSWRGTEGGIAAAKQHHDVIMTPGDYVYLDKYQSLGKTEPIAIGGFLPVSKVYVYEPVPETLSPEEARYIKGAQGNVWTEYIKNSEHVEYMVYPRAIALAEVLWSPKDKRNYDNFLERLKTDLPRLERKGVNYAKHVFEVRGIVESDGKGGVQVKLDSKLDGGKITYTTDSSAPTAQSSAYVSPIPVTQSGVVRAAVFQGENQYGNEFRQAFVLHKAVGKTVTLAKPPHENYNPGSPFVLVNGIEGVKEFNDNQWAGYSGGTMEAVIDLGDSTEIGVLGLNTLGNKDQWIYPPKQVNFYVSKDGKHFTEAGERKEIDGRGIIKIRERLKKPVNVRYVKVVARAVSKIPEGAPGEGSPAWLFVDELIVQ
ncbi:family 20 glycosylhydrolase [Chitinophaga sp. GCM10012297]|uniref:beta-N-acetylhexosaminidase n=1 Tax=Chitinophaga chungangae TaxID=2821488 RepID=A0ABS3YK91_9BACT|nr:family 20 glycosylhydrolase [Chitinophaga chungangae]MBO9155103.1 family 20 glycosylhydrolase [Chitinophaga chungangae]